MRGPVKVSKLPQEVGKCLEAALQQLHLDNAQRLEFTDFPEIPLRRRCNGLVLASYTSASAFDDPPRELRDWAAFEKSGYVVIKHPDALNGAVLFAKPGRLEKPINYTIEMTDAGGKFLIEQVQNGLFQRWNGMCVGRLDWQPGEQP